MLDVGDHHLELARLQERPPTRQAARAFGARLAGTHDAGAAAYGAGPDGWPADGFFGPLSEPLPMTLGTWPTWGRFYA